MELLKELRAILGEAHVLTGKDAAPYGRDFLGTYVSHPLAVVRPATTQEVSRIVKLAARDKTPIVPIAGNTGLTGGTHAEGALMIAMERMNAVRAIRPEARIMIAEAGCILDNLHAAAAEHGLKFPLTFGARGSCMLGGNLGTNAGGSNVVRYGNTRALCLGLEVVLPDGEVMDLLSELHKDNSGYDLKDLFIGAEGTLGIITAAVMKLVPEPRAYATAMITAPRVEDALTLLNRLQEATGGAVEAFEYMPRSYMREMKVQMPDVIPPLGYDQDCTILVEVGATAPRDGEPGPDGEVPIVAYMTEVLGEMMEEGLVLDAAIAASEAQRKQMWHIRESAAEIALPRSPQVNTDISVPLDQVAPFIEEVHARLARIDPDVESFIVSHLGDGNIHLTVYPSHGETAHLDRVRALVDDVAAEFRGSFSAEHGIGKSKLPSMERLKDPVARRVMRQIKSALDPDGIMNPGKTVI